MAEKMIEAWLLVDSHGLSKLFSSRPEAEEWRARHRVPARLCAVVEWGKLSRLIESSESPAVAVLPVPEPLRSHRVGQRVRVEHSGAARDGVVADKYLAWVGDKYEVVGQLVLDVRTDDDSFIQVIDPTKIQRVGENQPPLSQYHIGELVRALVNEEMRRGRVRDYWLSAEGWIVLVVLHDDNDNLTDKEVCITDRKNLWRIR